MKTVGESTEIFSTKLWLHNYTQEHRLSDQQPYFQMDMYDKHVSTCIIQIVFFLTASVTDNKGRRSCLRLKVFVRPQSESYIYIFPLCMFFHSVRKLVVIRLQISDVQVSFFNSFPSVFFHQDNCVKHSGSVQEGLEFDNSHNSIEPRGQCMYV